MIKTEFTEKDPKLKTEKIQKHSLTLEKILETFIK